MTSAPLAAWVSGFRHHTATNILKAFPITFVPPHAAGSAKTPFSSLIPWSS
jgi:hypothetical protein